MTKTQDYEAICLKTTPYRETDVIAAFYTREAGLIRAVARGVKSSKTKLAGACVPMTLNTLSLKGTTKAKALNHVSHSNSLMSLSGYQRLHAFDAIQTNLTAVGIAGTFLEIIYHLGHDTDSAGIFDLLLAILNNLNLTFQSQPQSTREWLMLTMEGHRVLLETIGYGHAWQNCIDCHEALPVETVSSLVFAPQAGGFFCPQCYAMQSELFLRDKVRVSQQTIQIFLGYTQHAALLDSAAIEKCFKFLEYYWQYRLERPLNSFKVLFSLMPTDALTKNAHDLTHKVATLCSD